MEILFVLIFCHINILLANPAEPKILSQTTKCSEGIKFPDRRVTQDINCESRRPPFNNPGNLGYTIDCTCNHDKIVRFLNVHQTV